LDISAFVLALASVLTLWVLFKLIRYVDWGSLTLLFPTLSPSVKQGFKGGYSYFLLREKDGLWYSLLVSPRHTGEDVQKAVLTPLFSFSGTTRAKAIRTTRQFLTLLKGQRSVGVDNTMRARFFASMQHRDQMYGNQPYIEHLISVYNLWQKAALSWGKELTPPLISGAAATWLHDCLEDTSCTQADIRRVFGADVLEIVEFCTDDTGPNRKTRKTRTHERVRALLSKEEVNPLHVIGRQVKLADRISNVRSSQVNNPSLYKMYCEEHEEFMAAYFPDIRTNGYDETTRTLLTEYHGLLPIQVTDRFYRSNDTSSASGVV
jgi:hypothetical protein